MGVSEESDREREREIVSELVRTRRFVVVLKVLEVEELVCTLNFVIVSWNQKFNFGKVSGSIFDFFKNYGRNVI